ncbi:MAG: inorganic phosphate transporter [Candidatus Zixiibacteriota bacterium]|nr:MAG: inorganic phosphate transporter [candidate division Zixibacteria bacterium]
MEILLGAVILLACFAIFDLMVGVSNDAVNFLNSSIGSRVAPRHIIMIIASLGILAGVTFSSGMMEVARKGIFHPHLFNMPELLFIFLAVMLTDIILLDLFNTFGLPTSTTVSIVFELLGAAVAVSVWKIVQMENDLSALSQYINTSRAMVIILGILLSVVVAFVCGMLAQFFSRLLFTFDYVRRLSRYGAIWGGIALASITYFILIKGAKGASFMSADTMQWITSNAVLIIGVIVIVSAVVLQLLLFLKINILKPIVLVGTFALAMAFAANDLVNFIGVPMAGYHAYEAAAMTDTPLTVTMDALGAKVPTETYLLLLAGLVMVLTLWFSRKARSVTQTEIGLSQQREGEEQFDSSASSRFIVRFIRGVFGSARTLAPAPVRSWIAGRLDPTRFQADTDAEGRPSFDLLRASVNLMVASAVISFATSQKLPLSTTYVTFMVAMGTSFADQAWGRESAVYRVTGVLTVISGWFMTALLAFTISACFATVIFYGKLYGVLALLALVALGLWKNKQKHRERARSREMEEVFNLKKVSDVQETLYMTFEHTGHLLREIQVSLNTALEALFQQNELLLRAEDRKSRKIQRWSNIVIANVFKAMRLLQKEHIETSAKYGQTIRRLQKLVDGHRDIVARSYSHVRNHHKGLLSFQVEELQKVRDILNDIFSEVESVISRRQMADVGRIIAKIEELRTLAGQLHEKQAERVRDGTSKTRLTILFYSIVGNAMMLSKQNLKLLEIFEESFGSLKSTAEFDLD